MSEQKDFEFLKGLACAFFGKRSIIKTLTIIDEQEISGWEKWMQIEFAKFCNGNNNITDWCREERYKLDKRTSKKRSVCSIDFSLRQKYKQTWIALELKQRNRASSCIKSMLKDVVKISKIKNSENDIRTIWCIGVHKSEDEKKIQGYIAKYEIEFDLEIKRSHVYTKKIGRSAYSFTLF
ncbi:MAG: hypothetical protein JRJ69_09855 [Deltaproteobacteria bacterium]|nr:hypothetical protein [Deltaproteobacteria bacterium]MBW2034066.1 hypothetical protein [Deltaproteobacteria bacterium]MBW2115449.1 hypothetical protein [Deltaproteobacteria bacterium]